MRLVKSYMGSGLGDARRNLHEDAEAVRFRFPSPNHLTDPHGAQQLCSQQKINKLTLSESTHVLSLINVH